MVINIEQTEPGSQKCMLVIYMGKSFLMYVQERHEYDGGM